MRVRHSRRGFTLMELLLVITIILVLMGLLTVGVMAFMQTGPRLASETNMKSIKKTLDRQWQAVSDQARQEEIPSGLVSAVVTQAGATDRREPSVRTTYIALKLKQAFPTSFAEALDPTPLPAWEPYVRFLNGNGITAANVATNTTAIEIQQAVMLFVALTRGPQNTGVSADSWGSSAVAKLKIKNDAGTDVEVDGFVDAWRHAILFTRAYQGGTLKAALLSRGPDAKHGVDTSNFNITTAGDARDNIVVVDP